MSNEKLNQFIERIYSFHEVARITKDDIPGDCKFIADPFIHYDSANKLWVLFAEVAFPARRQFIGTLTSSDLREWNYRADAVKGSRESFPFITQTEGYYLMMPCVDASSAPGLVSFYKSESLLGPWSLISQFVLRNRISDRVLVPSRENKRYFMIYGKKNKMSSVLSYLEITFSPDNSRINLGRARSLLSNRLIPHLQKILTGRPRLVMRPAGSLIPAEDGFFMPIQGTSKGRYGECFALSHIHLEDDEIIFLGYEFIKIKRLCPELVASHHFSFCRYENSEVFVIDGCMENSDWEVRVFAR